jgi:Icc-related predicted phosphoesterase
MEPRTVVLVSDTHEQHRTISVPYGDVLIHAGDFTYFNRAARVVEDFNAWLSELPHKHKIVIPGNHESRAGGARWAERITAATVLINGGIEIEGIRIWGSPNTPLDWGAFGSSTADELAVLYGRIPLDTDILVTHGPPFGILDRESENGEPQGCRELLTAVRSIRPTLHVFGHIHQGYGRFSDNNTVYVNAALPGSEGRLTKKPMLFHFCKKNEAV